MANVNGDEFSALWLAIADVRDVQGQHSARLEEHSRLLVGLAAAQKIVADDVRSHTVTLAEHGEMLREIIRRLDAA